MTEIVLKIVVYDNTIKHNFELKFKAKYIKYCPKQYMKRFKY